jgi:glycosyltransferase involved in cell wall biosynthesis
MSADDLSGKHIAIVTSGLGAGGAERVIAQLAARWTDAGARVSLVTFDSPDDPIFHPLKDDVEVHRLALHAPGKSSVVTRFWLQFRRVRAVRRFSKRARPDVVIAFLTKVNLIALMANFGTRIPVVACERNNPERQDTHPLWNRILYWFYGRAALIVCQTKGSIRCIPERLHDKVVVIPNPVVPFGGRGDTSGFTIAAVGRLTPQKGFDLLIDAFARIAERHPLWTLDIWGEGAERAALESQVRDAKLENRIRLRGQSERPGSWLDETAAFILSSRYEGFPNVLGEAMAAGLPVVATRCDFGPAEMIEDGKTGLLVETESVEALSDAIDRLLADASLRADLGREAALDMRRYGADLVNQLWEQALKRVFRA